MRESLHQLSLALALPLAVTAVWIVRGDPSGVPATQTATAYRAELADLPLPTPQRLRAPREATDGLGVHRHPDDPIARPRRVGLPDRVAPQPIELAVEAGSAPDWGIAPSPRDGQPQRTGAPALAAFDAFPTLSTPLIVASRTAGIRARTGAAQSNAGTAVETPEPDPDAKVAAPASTDPEKTRVAPVDRDSARDADGAPVVKIADGPRVPTRIPVKPSAEAPKAPTRSPTIVSHVAPDRPSSAKPGPGVAAVPGAAPVLPEKSPGRTSPSPISPSHASPRPSVPSPSKAEKSVSKRERDADFHETTERGTGRSSNEKGWREELADSLPSPALANAIRTASEPLDLSLDRDESKDSLLHKLLPAPSVTPQPAQWLAAADPIAEAPDNFVAVNPHTLPDFARALAEDFGLSSDAEDGASSPPWLFSPILTSHVIPEPASALLLGAALAGLAALRRRSHRG